MTLSSADQRLLPDRRRVVERRMAERRALVDRRKMAVRRAVRESACVHIRRAMQLLARLEPVAPTDETREEFRVANQRLWLALQELPPTHRVGGRGAWVALFALLGVAVAGVAVFITRGPAAPREPGVSTTAAALPQSTSMLDTVANTPAPKADELAPSAQSVAFAQATESLAIALQNYNDRLDVFARQQLSCAVLESAFVAVNQRWVSYSSERKRLGAPLPRARAAADRAFYAAVDSAERRHGQSGCPRP
jgi:hypothetical protein